MASRSEGCGQISRPVNGAALERVIEPVLDDVNDASVNRIVHESVDEVVDWMLQCGCGSTVEALRLLRSVVSQKLHEKLHNQAS